MRIIVVVARRCMHLVDLNSDGDWKLIVADLSRMLKVQQACAC